jgi:hypothetical protein
VQVPFRLHPFFFCRSILIRILLGALATFPPNRCLIPQDGKPEPAPDTLLEAVMKIHLHVFRSLFGKAVLASAALGGFLLFAGAPGAKANGRDDCNRRISYTQYRYNEAIERYGLYSSAARHWAHERHEAYVRCDRFRDRYNRDWDRR